MPICVAVREDEAVQVRDETLHAQMVVLGVGGRVFAFASHRESTVGQVDDAVLVGE